MRALVVSLALIVAGPVAVTGQALAVRHGEAWVTWWRAAEAPTRWPAADRRVTEAVAWRPAAAGLEVGELTLAGSGLAWRTRVILARFAPTTAWLRLEYDPDPLGRPDRWDIEDADPGALLAINAGQFTGRGPWGWLVSDGKERQAPGHGSLAPAIVQDTTGALFLIPARAIDSARATGSVRFAIQSYPAVLEDDGMVPWPLRAAGRGVDLVHRDARVALCQLRDGRWLAMLTRFEGLGGALASLPIGPTTPEMAALAGALGCASAVLLDGGMSGQLMVRDRAGTAARWNGLRRVPAGLTLRPRQLTCREEPTPCS